MAQQSNKGQGGQSKEGGASLEEREYVDNKGEVHHHTKKYMEQHGGEQEQQGGQGERKGSERKGEKR